MVTWVQGQGKEKEVKGSKWVNTADMWLTAVFWSKLPSGICSCVIVLNSADHTGLNWKEVAWSRKIHREKVKEVQNPWQPHEVNALTLLFICLSYRKKIESSETNKFLFLAAYFLSYQRFWSFYVGMGLGGQWSTNQLLNKTTHNSPRLNASSTFPNALNSATLDTSKHKKDVVLRSNLRSWRVFTLILIVYAARLPIGILINE